MSFFVPYTGPILHSCPLCHRSERAGQPETHVITVPSAVPTAPPVWKGCGLCLEARIMTPAPAASPADLMRLGLLYGLIGRGRELLTRPANPADIDDWCQEVTHVLKGATYP